MKRPLLHSYEDVVSVDNLLSAWREFVRGKRNKPDVQEFGFRLMDNILQLHADLENQTYCHGPYQAFRINDPKPREIHKATVRDRLVHRAIYRILYPFYHQTFIADSFSCRLTKGAHKALNRFRAFAYQVSQNHTKTCWVLKCDIRKFFASIDQGILLNTLRTRIPDQDVLWLLSAVINSFSPGLPLGNLTSQLLVNIYLNEFDQFIKGQLQIKYYLRYADDFVFLSASRVYLQELLPRLDEFLKYRLCLQLHPDKIFLKTFSSGVDFLGWGHFPDHRVLRTTTKRRMLRRVAIKQNLAVVNSYFGLLRHGNTKKLVRKICDKMAANARTESDL